MMVAFISVTLIVMLLIQCQVASFQGDPSDFFLGAQHRPKLEIVNPENGQVLDDTDLEITIKLSGYEVPSSFHDSKVCIAVSTDMNVSEQCFDQSPEFVFHANGLTPGKQYSLQVAYFERGKAIAVSVRNFKVAGIKGLLQEPDEQVSIMTAVQVALQYQTKSMMIEAESIYRSILSEHPSHPHALHLMGVVFYQKGDPISAIPFIQKALLGNTTDEGFYNTLGECYRLLGRTQDAMEQFSIALGMNPKLMTATFNMGLTLQQDNQWDKAVEYYRIVTEELKNDVSPQYYAMREEARIRECDLLTALHRKLDAVRCWEIGIQQFPDNEHVYNELGNLIGQNGQYEDALELYKVAIMKGSFVAKLNAAYMLELQGYHLESIAAYEESLYTAQLLGIPLYHIQVRKATVLPIILPASTAYLLELRSQFSGELDALLRADAGSVAVDNAPPLYFGFSIGYHLAFHGEDNVALKRKLYRVYARMCPALLQGYFMDRTSDQLGSVDTSLTMSTEDDAELGEPSQAALGDRLAMIDEDEGASDTVLNGNLTTTPHLDENPVNESMSEIDSSILSSEGTKSLPIQLDAMVVEQAVELTSGSSLDLTTGAVLLRPADDKTNRNSHRRIAPDSSGFIVDTKAPNSAPDNKPFSHQLIRQANEISWRSAIPHKFNKDTGKPLQRVGFVSRNFELGHPAGLLIHGLVPLLSAAGYEIIVFHIDSVSDRSHESWDEVKETIATNAHVIGYLPLNIGDCASVIRAAEVDILIYPEIGFDPVTYFLAYSRLAPVQTVWMGHPETSGISAVDYFVTSDVEPPEMQARYSEKMVRMHGLGAVLIDTYTSSQHSSPRSSLLERARLIEQIGIPRSAHLYIVAQPLYRLHADFDAVLIKILLQDRLGYIVLVDAFSQQRSTWKNLLLMRLAGGYSREIQSRIVFYHPVDVHDTIRTIGAGHVLLDPFPVSGLSANLHALAMSVPVVTMPSERLGGKFALILYCMLDYGFDDASGDTANSMCGNKAGSSASSSSSPSKKVSRNVAQTLTSSSDSVALVASSPMEYLSAALAIAHKPKLREKIVKEINERRDRLFQEPGQQNRTLSDWNSFIQLAVSSTKYKW